jgi:hypothetical protein
MSDIEKKRGFVYDLYPYKGWHRKVNKMSDAQILAIYLREQNKAKEKPREETKDNGDSIPF